MRYHLQVLLLLPILALGQPPPGYYDPTYGLSGEALREALYDIISGHTMVPNNQLWDAFGIADARPDGTVWDIYSDVPGGTPPYTYEFVEDQCGTYNSEGDCFNREHSFPRSWFNEADPMDTDLFHIYPTDAWVNQQRGNLAYGMVTNPNWTSQNGSKRGPCVWPGCSGTVFEPIDAYKGDLARSYFYMLTRYLPQLGSWNSPMMENGEFTAWASSMLINWHVLDPVSPKEIARNNAVYGLQNNRNPYIDEPQWVHYVWGPTASVAEAVAPPGQVWTSDGILSIRLNDLNGMADLHIFDATGRLVLSSTVREQVTDLPLQVPAGVYNARLTVPGAVMTTRFVQ